MSAEVVCQFRRLSMLLWPVRRHRETRSAVAVIASGARQSMLLPTEMATWIAPSLRFSRSCGFQIALGAYDDTYSRNFRASPLSAKIPSILSPFVNVTMASYF